MVGDGFDFFLRVSSLFNFPFCVTLVFSFCQKKYLLRHLALLSTFFIIIIIIIIIHAKFFFVLPKKKTFPFVHVYIYYALNQPNQVIILQSFFFLPCITYPKFFLFHLQVSFFPLYLSFLFFQNFHL